VWHASVAVRWPDLSPKYVAQWSAADWKIAEQALQRVLRGVGCNVEHREVCRITVQVRRLVNAEEHALVGPAIDAR
jgi:hypothetical protein